MDNHPSNWTTALPDTASGSQANASKRHQENELTPTIERRRPLGAVLAYKEVRLLCLDRDLRVE
jgi:hypothetical protein